MKRINEDHKEIASGKKKDDEGYMARIELDSIERSIKNLRKAIKSADTQLPAWVQSKITRAADYIDSATEYLQSDQDLDENISFDVNPEEHKKTSTTARRQQKVRKLAAGTKNPNEAKVAREKSGIQYNKPQLEETSLVDQILSEMGCGSDKKKKKKKTQYEAKESKNIAKKKDPCWDGYRKDPSKKDYEEGSCVKIDEAIMPQKNGHNMSVTLMWRAKYYNIQMFFPQLRIPSRREVADEANKVYPGCKVITYAPCAIQSNVPVIQVPDKKSKNYLMNNGTIGEEVEISEAKKSQMKCNKPKAEPHGSGETGKSHVVKACEGGKEKLIRFGQKGVKGSPKKKGESATYAKRRRSFRARHKKNIKKGKMSAAYWADKVKWE